MIEVPAVGEGTLAEALAVLAKVPELAQGRAPASYAQRLAGRRALILVARVQGHAVGFKIGHALQPHRPAVEAADAADDFYSWIGGVHPAHRGRGIAQALLQAQQQWAVAQGFRAIQVKSSARFPAMLALLARNRYRLLGPDEGKLRFEKVLERR